MQPKYPKGTGVSFRFDGTERKGMVTASFTRHGRVVYDITGSPHREKYLEVPESAIISRAEIEPIRDPNRSKISQIEVKLARQIFGESAYNPNRQVVILRAENGARLSLTVPLGTKYADGQWEIFDPDACRRSIGYDKSRFGAFIRRYGHWPNVGIEVDTEIDNPGYLTIKVN